MNITCLYNSEDVLFNDSIINDCYISRKKCYCKEIPDAFMNNTDVNCKRNCLQSAMENVTDTIAHINLFTEEMNFIIISEMDRYLTNRPINRHLKSKKQTPFWNQFLQNLWVNVRLMRKNFRKCKNIYEKTKIWNKYREGQLNFDKHFKYFKRRYDRYQLQEIECFISSNPKEFWNKLNKFGPKKTFNIPMEVVDKDGNIFRDSSDVLACWRLAFEG